MVSLSPSEAEYGRLLNRRTELLKEVERINVELAERYGHFHGGKLTKGGGRLTLTQRKEVHRRSNAGEDTGALAEEFGISRTYVVGLSKRKIWD